MSKIALIEDEQALCDQYRKALESAGHELVTFMTKSEAIEGLEKDAFDAWVLDIHLGDNEQAAGIEIIGWAKENGIKTPILVVSGLDAEIYDRIVTVLGAWDFVSKPISSDRLVSKVKVLIDTCSQAPTILPTVPGLVLDSKNPGDIRWKQKAIKLPITPYKILVRLVETPNSTVSWNKLFGCVATGATKTNVRQHIKTLKAKFSEIDSEFSQIQSRTGEGYIWES